MTAIIEAHSYTPDPQARGLAFRRSFLIGYLFDNPNPQYVLNAQQGVLDGLRDTGFELLVRPCDRSSPHGLDEVRGFVERQKLAGVVLFPAPSEDERLIALLRELDCPYVRVASVALESSDAMVAGRDAKGAQEAGEHLARLGHTRIAYVSGPAKFLSAAERRKGFEAGLAGLGLALDPRYTVEGAYTYDSGLEAGRRLLALGPPPTAVFAGNDEMALGVYRAAREAGLNIPRDLSVTGFDDSQLAARAYPALTTVRLPIRDMGRLAAQRLVQKITGRRSSAAGVDAPTLVVRSSTAPPAA